jgi:hypothetical protein
VLLQALQQVHQHLLQLQQPLMQHMLHQLELSLTTQQQAQRSSGSLQLAQLASQTSM